MTIQLPDDLVVSNRRVEVRNISPEEQRCPEAADRIEMPIDGRAG